MNLCLDDKQSNVVRQESIPIKSFIKSQVDSKISERSSSRMPQQRNQQRLKYSQSQPHIFSSSIPPCLPQRQTSPTRDTSVVRNALFSGFVKKTVQKTSAVVYSKCSHDMNQPTIMNEVELNREQQECQEDERGCRR